MSTTAAACAAARSRSNRATLTPFCAVRCRKLETTWGSSVSSISPSSSPSHTARIPPVTRCADTDRNSTGERRNTWLDSGTPGTVNALPASASAGTGADAARFVATCIGIKSRA